MSPFVNTQLPLRLLSQSLSVSLSLCIYISLSLSPSPSFAFYMYIYTQLTLRLHLTEHTRMPQTITFNEEVPECTLHRITGLFLSLFPFRLFFSRMPSVLPSSYCITHYTIFELLQSIYFTIHHEARLDARLNLC
jgi:hypothetical protein